MFTDLTDFKNKELEIKKTSDFYTGVLENITEGLCVFEDKTGKLKEVNAAYSSLTGYSKDELFNDEFNWDSLHLKDEIGMINAHKEKAHSLLAKEVRFVKTLVSKSGKRVPVLTSYKLINVSGVEYRIAVFSDITELKEMENALQKEQEYYKEFFDASPSGIAVYDEFGRFYDVSPALCKMLGYTKEELLSNTFDWNKVLIEREKALVKEKIVEAINSKKLVTYDVKLKSKYGKNVYTLTSTKVLPKKTFKESTKFVVYHLDISEIKEKEQELSELLDNQDKAISSIGDRFDRLMKGDLNSPVEDVPGKLSAISDNLRNLIEVLKLVVSNIFNASEELQNSLNVLFSGNEYLDDRTQEQAAGIEEMSTSLKEFSSSVVKNSEVLSNISVRMEDGKESIASGVKISFPYKTITICTKMYK